MAEKPISRRCYRPRPMSPATVTPVRKPRAGDPGGDLDAPWRVIVLNDNHNTFDGVAFALSSVLPGVGFDQGMNLANRIHSTRPCRRLVRSEGAGRALLGAAQGPRPHDGPARPPLALVGSGPCCSRSPRRGSSGSASSPARSSSSRCSRPSTSPAATRTFPASGSASTSSSPSLFFVGTMAGVIFFAKEEEEAHGAEATETHGTETGEEPLTTTEGRRRARGRRGGGRGRVRLSRLRRLPHARGCRRDRERRPEPRRGEARRRRS